MIRINCTQCRTQLEIDDAFSGGVCRCQHCGAIQTVPSQKKRPASPVPDPTKGAKTLYQASVPRGDGRSGSGINRLADTVPSSSSLTGTGKPANRVKERDLVPAETGPVTSEPAPHPHLHAWIYGFGGVIVVLTALVVWLMIRGGSAPEQTASSVTPTTPPSMSAAPSSVEVAPMKVTKSTADIRIPDISNLPASGTPASSTPAVAKPPEKPKLVTPSADRLAKGNDPRFYGLKVEGATIAYVLDRHTGMGDKGFADLRQSLYRSLVTLKSTQQFRVVLVGRKADAFVWPQTGYVAATKDNIAACKEILDEQPLIPDKEEQPQDAMVSAWQDGTALVLFATSRDGYDDKAAANWLKDAARDPKTQVYGFNLNGSNKTSRALNKLADSTHGVYRELSAEDARAFAQGRK